MSEEGGELAGRAAAFDSRARREIQSQLASARRRGTGVVTAADLAEALYLVLADGLRPDTESHTELSWAWESLRGHGAEGSFGRRVFDFETYFLGAYATLHGIDLALEGEARARVHAAFTEEASNLVNRLRRRTPSWRSVRWHLHLYAEAVGESPEVLAPSYLGVGECFADLCDRSTGDGLAETLRPHLVMAGLDLFYAGLAGTIRAVTSWEIAWS